MTSYAAMPHAEYRNICEAVRKKAGLTTMLTSGDILTAISNDLSLLRIETGIVKVTSNVNFINLPVDIDGACAVLVRAADYDALISEGENSVYDVRGVITDDANAMPNCIAHYYDGAAMAISATAPQNIDGKIRIVVNTSMKFRPSSLYLYQVWYLDMLVASFDVSADGDGNNAVLQILRYDTDSYRAVLTGIGATRDFKEDEIKPWSAYVCKIRQIHIQDGITAIGAYLFSGTENVRLLNFESIEKISHLGERAFYKSGFCGDIDLPGLQDTEFGTAFEGCVNITSLAVPETVTNISADAFVGCLNIRKIQGMGNVSSVGDCAFVYCPKLTDIDVSVEHLTSAGTLAFHLSSVGEATDFSKFTNTQFGSKSTAIVKFGESMLGSIKATALGTGYMSVPNNDSQSNYPNIPFCTKDGKQLTMLESGCMAFSLYHAWNALHPDSAYPDFPTWWEEKVLAVNAEITSLDRAVIFEAMLACLGWSSETLGADTAPSEKKARISAEIEAGRPCMASIIHGIGIGGHAVLIVGCDEKTDRLVVVDSGEFSGDEGQEYSIAYQDLFVGSTDAVAVFNFGDT